MVLLLHFLHPNHFYTPSTSSNKQQYKVVKWSQSVIHALSSWSRWRIALTIDAQPWPNASKQATVAFCQYFLFSLRNRGRVIIVAWYSWGVTEAWCDGVMVLHSCLWLRNGLARWAEESLCALYSEPSPRRPGVGFHFNKVDMTGDRFCVWIGWVGWWERERERGRWDDVLISC